MEIIIDGYNLIYHCGFNGVGSSPLAIRRSRRRLFDLLESKLEISVRQKTTIVFDAEKLPSNESNIDSVKQQMRVIFSVGYEDADSLIEELLHQHSHPKNLVVVSNDHRIQNAASRRKAKAIGCEEWLDWMDRHASPCTSAETSDSESETKPKPGGDANASWIKVFSGDEQATSKSAFQQEMEAIDEDVKELLSEWEDQEGSG